LNALQDKVRALEANLAGSSSSSSSVSGSDSEGEEEEDSRLARGRGKGNERGRGKGNERGEGREKAKGKEKGKAGERNQGRRTQVAMRLEESLMDPDQVSGLGQVKVELNLVESKLVVSERKLAEAERKLAETERNLADTERKLAEAERALGEERERHRGEEERLRGELEVAKAEALHAGAEGREMERYAAEIEELREAVQAEKKSVEKRLQGVREKHAAELVQVKEEGGRVKAELAKAESEIARLKASARAAAKSPRKVPASEAAGEAESLAGEKVRRVAAEQEVARLRAALRVAREGSADRRAESVGDPSEAEGEEKVRRIEAEQEVARLRAALRVAREGSAERQAESVGAEVLVEERKRHVAEVGQLRAEHSEAKRLAVKFKGERDALQAQLIRSGEEWRGSFERNAEEMGKLRESLAAAGRRVEESGAPTPAVAALQQELSEREATVQTLLRRNDRLARELGDAKDEVARLETELGRGAAPSSPASPAKGEPHGVQFRKDLLERAEQMERDVGRLLVSEEDARDEEQRAAKARLGAALKTDPGNVDFIQSLYDDVMVATARTHLPSREEWHRHNLAAGGSSMSPGVSIATVIDPDLLSMGETMNERLGAIQQEMSRLATTLSERAERQEEDRRIRAATAVVHPRPRRGSRHQGTARESHSYWRDVGPRPR